MTKRHRLALLPLLLGMTGCTALGMKSVPWATNVAVRDTQAIDFLRDTPAVDPDLGAGLHMKDPLADGRLIGFVASGGGARAAAFTLGVLTELQHVQVAGKKDNVLDDLDFLSSNSGGSWGVAAYLVDRARWTGGSYSLERRMRAPSTRPATAASEPAPYLLDKFLAMNQGPDTCLSQAMERHLLGNATYADIYPASRTSPLPRAFLNASLLPAQAPFLFEDAFLHYYRVTGIGTCKVDVSPPIRGIADLPIRYAAAASGSVPGFYYAYATTGLCVSGPLARASFCHGEAKDRFDYLRIADGGLYDNIGYKTAYEWMFAMRKAAVPKAVILVNSATSVEDKSVKPRGHNDRYLATIAGNGTFAVQDSTFERLYKPMFESVGVRKPVLLDFYSAAHFASDQVGLLDGLDELAAYAANDVDCYQDGAPNKAAHAKWDNAAPPAIADSIALLQRRGGDCLSENFYRAGTLGKTTYEFDTRLFTVMWQLGRLTVRMQKAQIEQALM